MTQQLLINTPQNTGQGDTPYFGANKINANFTDLYSGTANLSGIQAIGIDPVLINTSSAITYNTTPIGSVGILAHTYDSTYNGLYGNIFEFAVQATVTSTVNTVAIYGSAVANGSGSKVWGGNFACVVNNAGATGIGIEVDVNMPTAGTGYGIAIDAVGANQAVSALQIQSNQVSGGFQYGILLNNASHSAINGSLIASDPGSACQYGINFGGVFSVNEILCPSFIVGATPVSINSSIQVLGSASALPSISCVGSATNIGLHLTAKGTGLITATGPFTIAVPSATATTCLTVSGINNAYTGYFQANTTSGQSFGVLISGGTTSADRALKIENAGNTQVLCYIDGVGDMSLFGALGINGASPLAQVTGWGTPTGASVQNNFSGSAATLGQCSAAIAEIIANLKSFGLYGA